MATLTDMGAYAPNVEQGREPSSTLSVSSIVLGDATTEEMQRCMDSIALQTLPPCEVILVHAQDCDGDTTEGATLPAGDTPFAVLSASALDEALGMASGDYLHILHGYNDMPQADAYELALAKLAQSQADAGFFGSLKQYMFASTDGAPHGVLDGIGALHACLEGPSESIAAFGTGVYGLMLENKLFAASITRDLPREDEASDLANLEWMQAHIAGSSSVLLDPEITLNGIRLHIPLGDTFASKDAIQPDSIIPRVQRVLESASRIGDESYRAAVQRRCQQMLLRLLARAMAEERLDIAAEFRQAVSRMAGEEAPDWLLDAYIGITIETERRRLLMERALAWRDERIAAKDEAIAWRDQKLAEKDKAIAWRDGKIAALDEAVTRRDGQLTEKEAAIAWRDQQIAAKDEAIAWRDERIAAENDAIAWRDEQLAKKEDAIAWRDSRIAEKDRTIARQGRGLSGKDDEIKRLNRQLKWKQNDIAIRDEQIELRERRMRLLEEELGKPWFERKRKPSEL